MENLVLSIKGELILYIILGNTSKVWHNQTRKVKVKPLLSGECRKQFSFSC